MCRLLGMISVRPESPAPWLVDAELSLLRQASLDPEALQADGWGIAWYEGGDASPRVEKGPEAVFLPAQREHFGQVASACTSPLVIAHLRKASNPMNLPRERLAGLENTQPFLSEGSIFAHNGWIPLPTETRSRLGERELKVRGVNDSEVLAQLFLAQLDATGDPVRAYAATVRSLHEVWEEHGRAAKGPHGGLNLLFSRSPRELWAFCHYTGDHGGCLSGLPRPYYEMSYSVSPERALVVSEPTDRHLDRWRPLRSGQYLHVLQKDGRLETEHGQVPSLPRFPELARPVETLPA